MRVAVLGAGMLGSCLAIELAHRGIWVDLFDREGKSVTQAGGRNEGKIHMGFVYGADPSNQTADVVWLDKMAKLANCTACLIFCA